MPPILESIHHIQSRGWKRLCFDVVQILHFLVAMCLLWAGIVEFIRDPPIFDAYGDATSTQNELPTGLFENDPRNIDNMQSLRLMDLPIVFMLITYFMVCWWLKFKGLSFLLTGSMLLSLLCFFIINFWATDTFDWTYYPSRVKGLETQVLAISISATSIMMVIFYERKRMPFKFKATLPIKPFGKTHIMFNFLTILFILFLCLMLWFSKLYISWACFRSHDQVLSLCERTNMVQCYPCNSCTPDGLRHCVKEQHHKMFHCLSPMDDVSISKGAFCLFNYNVSVYSFLTVFAYVGGLVVFMSTFIRFVVHYIFRGFFFIVRWWKLQHGARDGNRPRTESPIGQNLDEIVSEPYQYVEYEGQTIGCRERDLGDDVTSVSSIADEQGFVNASIG